MPLIDRITTMDSMVLERDYYTLLESHLNLLRKDTKTRVVPIPLLQAQRFTGDFYGLLDFFAIGKKFRYLIMRVNGLKSSTLYDGTLEALLLPANETMAQIMTIYASRSS